MSAVLATARAPGKLLLLGEHAVVYGAPALGFPLSRGVQVTLRAGTGRVSVTLGAGCPPPSGEVPAAPDDLVRRALREDAARVDVELHVDIPPMSGYGSSAAVAVALLRARRALRGEPAAPLEALWTEALAVEQAAHAQPSGVDPAIVVWGIPLRFTRSAESAPRIEPQPFARPLFIVAGCCGDHGGTRVSVTGLATLKAERPALVEAAMATLAEAARTGGDALRRGELDALGPALDLAHGVLSGLGLVGEAVEHAVRSARREGALGAKMSGAGGAGGAWIAAFDDETRAAAAAEALRADGATIFEERLG